VRQARPARPVERFGRRASVGERTLPGRQGGLRPRQRDGHRGARLGAVDRADPSRRRSSHADGKEFTASWPTTGHPIYPRGDSHHGKSKGGVKSDR
jgi:hypothetical protein